MKPDKKELAAITAVMDIMASEPQEQYIPRQEGSQPTAWQAWGRGQTMQYRDIIQRRIIKRVR